MAAIKSMNRRLGRLEAVTGGKVRVIWRDHNSEDLSAGEWEDLAYEDYVLIITWKVGDSDEKDPPQPDSGAAN